MQKHIEAEHQALADNNMGKAPALSGLFHIDIAEIADHSVYAAMIQSLITSVCRVQSTSHIRRPIRGSVCRAQRVRIGQRILLNATCTKSSLIIALYWVRPDTACESHAHHALLEAFAQNGGDAAHAIMHSHLIDLHSGLNLRTAVRTETSLAEALAGG